MSVRGLTAGEAGKNFKVVIRVRPPLEREQQGDKVYEEAVRVDSEKTITISENLSALDKGDESEHTASFSTYHFTFDHVYDFDSDQSTVYETTAKAAVMSTLEGYNATIIAYGQTGTGKTYTMEGFFDGKEKAGIIPRASDDIFRFIESNAGPTHKFLIRASYLQIYNECISDLLKPERSNLQIREDPRRGVFVEGLSEWVVRSPTEIFGLIERGSNARSTASTKMNLLSSRSHAIFIIICEQSTLEQGDEGEKDVRQMFKVGKLNLVDLAGSERVRLTGATGKRLEESKSINQSLSALGNVIAALTDTKGRQHIPYRDSKLTRILEDSLGGNCKTTMMACISPANEAFTESVSTLKFANRAKNIKNEAHVNEDLDQKTLLRKYERELKKLRQELEEKSRGIVDKRKLLELEESKRRAEEDKLAAITALEARSREFMKEKIEKRKLEEKIRDLQNQLLTGSHTVQDLSAFRSLQEEQLRFQQEYERKMREIEKEKQNIDQDKAQVDRYKSLLLKQRDIMIALTSRLHERDNSIVSLQEELDAYDKHQHTLEDVVDHQSMELLKLQKVIMEYLDNPKLETHKEAMRAAVRQVSSHPAAAVRAPEKRYHSEGATSLFMDDSATSKLDVDSLSADEKIKELHQLLEETRREASTSLTELEELRAEKVQLEEVLREKLDKMIHAEVEGRIQAYKKELDQWKNNYIAAHSGPDVARRMEELEQRYRKLEHENLRLRSAPPSEQNGRASVEIRRLEEIIEEMNKKQAQHMADAERRLEKKHHLLQIYEEENSRLRQLRGGATVLPESELTRKLKLLEEELHQDREQWGRESKDVQALRQKCSLNEKERKAMKTILESKIKTIVESVLSSSLFNGAPSVDIQAKASKELQQLQKIVNASIKALSVPPQ